MRSKCGILLKFQVMHAFLVRVEFRMHYVVCMCFGGVVESPIVDFAELQRYQFSCLELF